MKSVLKTVNFQYIFAVLMLCAGLAACASSASPAVTTPPKQLLRGLVDMQDISWHDIDNATAPPFDITNADNFPGLLGGVVINASWNQMQPSQDGPLDFTQIENGLAAVRTYNNAHPDAPLGVKLRIYAGSNAPPWAKTLNNLIPVTVYRNPGGCGGNPTGCLLTEGRFWTQQYISDWRAFQQKVAAKYDAEPLIQAVAVTSCASQTDEPFVPSGPASTASLQAAGYTDSAERECLAGAIEDYAAWHITPIDYTFNTYSVFPPGNGQDPAFTQSVITSCRQKLGAHCILNNHALSAPVSAGATPTPTPDPVYAMIASAGPPINFQTQSPRGMECLWTQTISQGIAYGARAIEVWPYATFDGFDSLTTAQVTQLRALFYASPPPAAPTPDPSASPCPAFN